MIVTRVDENAMRNSEKARRREGVSSGDLIERPAVGCPVLAEPE
jgi:hypothetical protein